MIANSRRFYRRIAMNDLSGQMSIFDFIPKSSSLAREKCLHEAKWPCNILNAHDVARECGIDCQYGCCKVCKENKICGACCWQSTQSEKTMQEDHKCYSCKHLNMDKKRVTGIHKQLYDFGCKISESGYIPGGCVIGDEDKWLKMQGCGNYEFNTGGNNATDT